MSRKRIVKYLQHVRLGCSIGNAELAGKIARRLSHWSTTLVVLRWGATYMIAIHVRDSHSFLCYGEMAAYLKLVLVVSPIKEIPIFLMNAKVNHSTLVQLSNLLWCEHIFQLKRTLTSSFLLYQLCENVKSVDMIVFSMPQLVNIIA